MSSTNGIPDSFWRLVPCGHPASPVAACNDQGVWLCHCGQVLMQPDTVVYHGYVPPGAAGPALPCDTCGCNVVVPVGAPPARPPQLDETLHKEPVPGFDIERIYEKSDTGLVDEAAARSDYDQLHAWAIETLRKERSGFFLVTMTGKTPVPLPGGVGYHVDMAVANSTHLEGYAQQVAWFESVRRVVDDQLAQLRRWRAENPPQEPQDDEGEPV